MTEREYEHRILDLAERLSELCSEVSLELDKKRKNQAKDRPLGASANGAKRSSESSEVLEPPIL